MEGSQVKNKGELGWKYSDIIFEIVNLICVSSWKIDVFFDHQTNQYHGDWNWNFCI